MAEAALSTVGTLWGWTAVTVPPAGYEGELPYGFGVVELPEGIRLITRLTEPDPDRLAFGQAMELQWESPGTTYGWAFAPAAEEQP
jgi:uncharacterized OB-fold protein